MFWNDIEEIKESQNALAIRIDLLDHLIRSYIDKAPIEEPLSIREGAPLCIRCDGDRVIDAAVEDIKKAIETAFSGQNTFDKFEDYMKNVDKLNAMINEFKGCVAMSRASLNEKKPRKKKKAIKKKAAVSPAP